MSHRWRTDGMRSCGVRRLGRDRGAGRRRAGWRPVAATATASSSTPGSQTGAPDAGRAGQFRLIAPDGLAGILGRERRATRRPGAARRRSRPTTTTAPPITGTFGVATTQQTFVDPTRSTPARGGNPTTSSRTIVTTVYYPTTVAPSTANPAPPVAPGPFPLVVFAHGYAIDAAAYAPLLEDLAAGGFVVAAPDFPGTSTAYSGGAIRSDSLQQPGDISFVITSMINLSGAPGPLFDAVNPAEVGDSGQSDGGVTAAAAAYNTCCIDPRIKASSILTGGAFGFDGQWFPPGTPPVLFVHATADEVNPYGASTSMPRRRSHRSTCSRSTAARTSRSTSTHPGRNTSRARWWRSSTCTSSTTSPPRTASPAGNQPGYSLQSG